MLDCNFTQDDPKSLRKISLKKKKHSKIACINWIVTVFPERLTAWRFCNNKGYTQKNGAVSKVNKKFISHVTRAQRTPSAAATVQVSHALLAVRFSCLLRGRGASFQDGVAAGKGFLCLG